MGPHSRGSCGHNMGWSKFFILICVALLLVTAAVLAALVAFAELGIGLHGGIALALGVLMTMGMAMGLMGLMFFSNRSGYDEYAHTGWGENDADRKPGASRSDGGRRLNRN